MKDRVAVSLAVLLVLLVAVEAVFAPREHASFAWHVPGFAALIGLFASIIVVQLSKTVGKKLLQRPERDDD
jgi:hypothetical protein